MGNNSFQPLEAGYIFSPFDGAYCNSNGLHYKLKIHNLTQSLCRCEPLYYGSKCDRKDESNLIIVMYGLLGVNGLLLLLILAVFCRSYFKWRNLCHLRSIAVERVKIEIHACNTLKSNIRRNQISSLKSHFPMSHCRKTTIQQIRRKSENFSIKSDFNLEDYMKSKHNGKNQKFNQRPRSKSIDLVF